MKSRGLPVDRLDLLQKWINDALSLKEQMMPPAPAMPEMSLEEQALMQAQPETGIQ
jgi:hypothetical protein